MKPLLPKTPRHLLTLSALFARRRPSRVEPVLEQDTRMPDEAEVVAEPARRREQMGRIAAEVALEEGGRRQYAPRGESQVIEARRG